MSSFHNKYSDEEVVQFMEYQLANRLTIRQAAAELHVAKSTLHNMKKNRLHELDPQLEARMDDLYQENLMHGRSQGGKAAMKIFHEKQKRQNEKPIEVESTGNQSCPEDKKERGLFGFLRRK